MKFVTPNKVPKPAALLRPECVTHLSSVINDGEDPIAEYYNGETEENGITVKTVVAALKTKYDNKCGYCESEEHDPTVDHHRPKGKVSGGAVHNKGYYWLCYEWTNFIPSCTDCNKPGAKHMKFPVLNQRKTEPQRDNNNQLISDSFLYSNAYLASESPLLIHPEYTDPKGHFDFDSSGVISGKTNRGTETVSTCNLDRKTLNVNRRKVYEYYFNKIEEAFDERYNNPIPLSDDQYHLKLSKIIYELLEDKDNPEMEFTNFRDYIFRHFNLFFIEPASNIDIRLPQKLKESFLIALNKYINK